MMPFNRWAKQLRILERARKGMMTSSKKGVRTCIACGKIKLKKELLRLIQSPDSTLVVDWRSNLGGRGAHVCPATGCITKAIKKRAADRSFKSKVTYPKVDELIKSLKESYSQRILTLLSSSIKRRFLSPGTDEATSAVKSGKAQLLILAKDFSSLEDMENFAKAATVAVCRYENKEILGKLTGRRPTGVLAICDFGLADALLAAISQNANLS